MHNRKLITAVALLTVCDLAGCAGREQRMAREWQEHDAECRKFGAEAGTPAYVDCLVALRAIESLISAALPLPNSPTWHEAQTQELSRDRAEQRQHEAHGHEAVDTAGCGRVSAGVLDCEPAIPLAGLPAGLDR